MLWGRALSGVAPRQPSTHDSIHKDSSVQINVTMRHGHLSESTQEKLVSKAEKLMRFFDRLTSIELIVDLKEPNKPRIDIKASAEHKHDFLSHDQGENLMAAVDGAMSKIEQQIRRYKEKVQDRNRDGGAKRHEEPAETAEDAEG